MKPANEMKASWKAEPSGEEPAGAAVVTWDPWDPWDASGAGGPAHLEVQKHAARGHVPWHEFQAQAGSRWEAGSPWIHRGPLVSRREMMDLYI